MAGTEGKLSLQRPPRPAPPASGRGKAAEWCRFVLQAKRRCRRSPPPSHRPRCRAAAALTGGRPPPLPPPPAADAHRLLYAVLPAARHYYPGHHECPERVTAIAAALERHAVFAGCAPGQATQLADPPAAPPEGLLTAVHTAEHLERLRATSEGLQGPAAVRDPDDPGAGGGSCRGSRRRCCCFAPKRSCPVLPLTQPPHRHSAPARAVQTGPPLPRRTATARRWRRQRRQWRCWMRWWPAAAAGAPRRPGWAWCGRRGTTPRPTTKWASACSTTRRWRRATRCTHTASPRRARCRLLLEPAALLLRAPACQPCGELRPCLHPRHTAAGAGA